MADYIYLLQNRLTPAQRRALEAVREVARAHSMPVFLVGGAVRDLSSGAPVRDLDFAVQGEVAALLDELKASGAMAAGENPVVSSHYLVFPGGVRAEIGPTLTVSYPKPGEAEAQPATILEDLRRRDFTANAMAISLNEGSYGLLLDPLNGIADMENRELRLSSNYGFIEQPALLLRAARLSARLGWALEERTQNRYESAKEEKYIDALPTFDRGYELEEIFHEEDPLGALEHLTEEGWSEVLYPAWSPAKADREAIDRVRDLIGQMEQMGIFVDPSPVLFPLLTARLSVKDAAGLKAMFPRHGFVAQIDALEGRSKDLANQLTSKTASPSETWKLLFAAEPEVVLWLAHTSRSGAIQAKFKAFLNEWPQARTRLPYALMQEMRITADLPGYDQLLEDLFFAQMDGKLSTPEATRAFLEPYSPPAPAPQAAPRRRPAKSARGRGRKAVVEEPTTEEADTPGADLADLTEDIADVHATTTVVTTPPAQEPRPEPAVARAETPEAGSKKSAKRAGGTETAASAAAVPSPAPAPKKTASKSVSAPAKGTRTAEKTPARAEPKAPAGKKASAKTPGRTAPPSKGTKATARSHAPAKVAGKGLKPAAKPQDAKSTGAKNVSAKAAPSKGAKAVSRPPGKVAAVPSKSSAPKKSGKVAATKAAAPTHRAAAASKRPTAKHGKASPARSRR